MGEQTTLLPPPPAPEPPLMSAREVLTRVDIMLACMEVWATKRGEMAGLMTAWGRWLRAARPYIEAAAERSNEQEPRNGWACPINSPDCTRNCGSYGCGN